MTTVSPSAGKPIHVPNVRVDHDHVQTVHFRATKKGVICSSRGKPKLIVVHDDHKFLVEKLEDFRHDPLFSPSVSARRPARAFSSAVRLFW
jgi:hypothetical protein